MSWTFEIAPNGIVRYHKSLLDKLAWTVFNQGLETPTISSHVAKFFCKQTRSAVLVH